MSESPSPGWYSDPSGQHDLRYWSGKKWMEHVLSDEEHAARRPHAGRAETVSSAQAPGWYSDPLGQHEKRYWDGVRWTQHVSTHGVPGVDPVGTSKQTQSPTSDARSSRVSASAEDQSTAMADRMSKRVQRQVSKTGVPARGRVGEAAMFNEPVLVVNQKAIMFGSNAAYEVFDQQGLRIGAVQEVGASLVKKAVGVGGENGTHRFHVLDPAGNVLLALTRPAKLLKSNMVVVGADGLIGEITQANNGWFGKDRFDLVSDGHVLGSVNAEDWQAWEFNIKDAGGAEIARISKTWAGWAKERFTKADNYVVQMHRPIDDPLRSLVIAAALAIDTALKQGRQITGSSRRTRRYR